MIDRRGALLAVGAMALLGRPTVAEGAGLAFEVRRNGRRIGQHALDFRRDGDELAVAIAIDLRVRFGPIPLYGYMHHNEERWKAGELTRMTSETDDNGTPHRVVVERVADGLKATSPAGTWSHPAASYATTYWHRRFLDRPHWINSQTGEPAACEVAPAGRERIATTGEPIDADRYQVKGVLTLDLWYRNDFWAGLAFPGPDGSEIRYLRSRAEGLETVAA